MTHCFAECRIRNSSMNDRSKALLAFKKIIMNLPCKALQKVTTEMVAHSKIVRENFCLNLQKVLMNLKRKAFQKTERETVA